jgi:Rho GTPase-activating protein 1
MREFRLFLGQTVVFEQYNDVHLPACVLKTFLRELTEPLLTFRLYPELLILSGSKYPSCLDFLWYFFLNLAFKRPDQIDVLRDLIIEKLPIENYNILKYLIEFLNLVRRNNCSI